MYKVLKFTILPILFLIPLFAFSQVDCPDDQLTLNIEFLTDDYGYEFSWELLADGQIIEAGPTGGEQYGNDVLNNIDLCLINTRCYELKFYDTYGDGFIGNGYLAVQLDGEEVLREENYGSFVSLNFNCPEGSVCENAETLDLGSINQNIQEAWYHLAIDTTGIYELSTCSSGENCETTIYIYENCEGDFPDNNEGTIYYNTESDSCGTKGLIMVPFSAEREYYVRIEIDNESCSEIQIDFSFKGTILGCTDPLSCNYNPLAIEDDGSCFAWEDPRCSQGPDLRLNQDVLEASMYMDQLENNDACLIDENCIKGYGLRDIIRFTTQIENVGNLDYFIGDPVEAPGQFEFDQCHNHWHYDGYAKYTLYDTIGNVIPIGYKNGFCVLDLTCPSFDMYTYGCDYMGITAGCTDIYDAYLDCQWLDITDVPDGNYVFVARVNEDLARDALGRPEMDSINNSAQVCFNLFRTNGEPQLEIIQECESYFDCEGTLYGNAEIDCNGNCNGMAVTGDLDEDQAVTMGDVVAYIETILSPISPPSKCTDLDDNGEINVYDAALLQSCINYGISHEHEGGSNLHNHCTFPAGIYNDVNPFTLFIEQPENESFVDVHILNEGDGLFAFQFELTGIDISSVSEMSNTPDQVFDINFNPETGKVIGLATGIAGLTRSNEMQNLVRVHFTEQDGEVCVSENMVFSSDNDELVLTTIEESCIPIVISSSEDLAVNQNVHIHPNPTSAITNITLENLKEINNYTIHHLDGRILQKSNITDQNFSVDLSKWTDGIYYITFSGKDKSIVRKLIVQNSND